MMMGMEKRGFKIISACSNYSFLTFVQNEGSDPVISNFILNSSLVAS